MKGASEFGTLLETIADRVPADDRNNRPNSIAIQIGSKYYYITDMAAFDQVLIG